MADKFGLRAWTINLRAWIFGFTHQAFKTTYIDAEKPLHEGAFFFTRRTLFPPLDKRNTRDKAKGLRITSERHIGELGVRCLSIINRGQDSPATVSYEGCFKPIVVHPRTNSGCYSSPPAGWSAQVYDTPRMISKRAVYIVIAIALTWVVGKAY